MPGLILGGPWVTFRALLGSDGRKKSQRTCGRQTVGFFLKVFFFPLISKFLLILVKRKNTSTPAACPLLQLLQAFKGRKLRDGLCPSLGAAPSLPHRGTCWGVSRCQVLHYRCRKGRFKIWRGALARSIQNPPQKLQPSPSASKCSSGGHGRALRCTLCPQGITARIGVCATAQ